MTQSDSQTSRESKRGRGVVVALVLLLLLPFGGAYVAAYYFAGDTVPRGASVAGVDIGGKSEDDAVAALEQGLAERTGRPVAVTVDGAKLQVQPEAAGLSVDYEASVAQAGGGERSWSPSWLWDHYTGGDDVDAVVLVDEADMATAIETLDKKAGTPPTEGAISFAGGKVEVVDAVAGESLDPAVTRDALVAAYLGEGDDATATLELIAAEPTVDQVDVQEALDSFANPAVSGPVTLVFDKTPVEILPREFSRVLSMKEQDGELVPDLDEDRLVKVVDSRVSSANDPVDATVRLVSGKPQVIPSRPGIDYDPADISATFLEVVVREPGERETKVKATVAAPDFTTKDARKLQIKEKVSTFSTYFPYAEYRNTNIGRAAEIINGTVLEPGETFSMNDIVGERTAENGFTDGFIISNGIFKEDLGGGVSQMATTAFNAAFFAGLKDVEHKPHSFYIDRYPVGREATVAWGAVDLRFENDTPYGILIESRVQPSTPSSQGEVTVSMWSTKHWDITSSTSDRYDFTSPETRTLTTSDCYPNTGYGGFDVDVTRFFRKAGESELDHKEVFHTTYTPSDTVICEAPEPNTAARTSSN